MRKIIARTAAALAGIGLALGVATAAAPAAQAAINDGTGYWKCGPAFTLVDQNGTTWYFGQKCVWVELPPMTPKSTAVKPVFTAR